MKTTTKIKIAIIAVIIITVAFAISNHSKF